MTTVPQFLALAQSHGSDVRFRRADSLIPCPCRTPEGFRDPAWHLQHPAAPMCDPNGMLADPAHTTDILVKAFVQPVAWVRTRINIEVLQEMYGGLETDDHFGIFPYEWHNVILNFEDWGRSGEDFIEYNGRRFYVANSNLLPDPSDGNPNHHWEVALKLISDEALI